MIMTDHRCAGGPVPIASSALSMASGPGVLPPHGTCGRWPSCGSVVEGNGVPMLPAPTGSDTQRGTATYHAAVWRGHPVALDAIRAPYSPAFLPTHIYPLPLPVAPVSGRPGAFYGHL